MTKRAELERQRAAGGSRISPTCRHHRLQLSLAAACGRISVLARCCAPCSAPFDPPCSAAAARVRTRYAALSPLLAPNPNPPSKGPPTSTAALAASQAFLKDRGSHASLSSAAAATALRTHPPSPTPVAQTVTKRMARKGSTSSTHSGSSLPSQAARRSPGSASMTGRSFRAPSPNRNTPSVEIDRTVPPVPAVPKDVPTTSVASRRASSLDIPLPGKPSSEVGRNREIAPVAGLPATPARVRNHSPQVVTLSHVPETDHDNSLRSVNFSRPISPLSSPAFTAASARSGRSGWFAGPVMDEERIPRIAEPQPKSPERPTVHADKNQPGKHHVAERHTPIPKQKGGHSAAGSKFASDTKKTGPSVPRTAPMSEPSAARPSIDSATQTVNPRSSLAVYDPSTRSFISKREAMARWQELNEPERDPEPPSDDDSQTALKDTRQRQHAAPTLDPNLAHVHHSDEAREEPRTSVPVGASHTSPPSRKLRDRPPTPPPGAMARSSQAIGSKGSDYPIVAQQSAGLNVGEDRPLGISRGDQSHAQPHGPPTAAFHEKADPSLDTKITSKARSRAHSLSPPRTAHFADVAVDISGGAMHKPPPRSLSPAKSVLKPSPSVPRRDDPSPSRPGLSIAATEEAPGVLMDDPGVTAKKKNARVSFDEEPVIAGTSAYAQRSSPLSPKGLEVSRWAPYHSEKPRRSEQGLDDVMTPRPALPSFGSIRDRSRRLDDSEVPEKVTETVSSSLTASVGSASELLRTSADHAIAEIVAQDLAARSSPAPNGATSGPHLGRDSDNMKSSARDPLPPEVTSVEGSGYISDSEESTSTIEDQNTWKIEQHEGYEARGLTPKSEPKTLADSFGHPKPPSTDVSVAADSPSSSVKKEIEPSKSYSVPGAWDDFEENLSLHHEKPTQARKNQSPQAQEETDSSDAGSIYSDAYEDLSDDEDGGFASIDAMVESTLIGSSISVSNDPSPESKTNSKSPPDAHSVEVGAPPSLPTEDWDATRPHWNTVSQARKQTAESPNQSRVSTQGSGGPAEVGSARKKRAGERRAHVNLESVAPPATASKPQPSAHPRKSAMKKTVRPIEDAPAADRRLKKTMRNNTESPISPSSDSPMRKTMRAMDAAPNTAKGSVGLAASRHSMPTAQIKQPRGAFQKRMAPVQSSKGNAQPSAATIGKKTPARTQANDSDSDASASSFVRQRPRSSVGAGGKFSMRKSMRGETVAAPPQRAKAPTMRPMSPPPSSGHAFRNTMRGSAEERAESPTGVRSSRFSIRSLSPSGPPHGKHRAASIDFVPQSSPTVSSSKKKTVKMPAFGKFAKSSTSRASAQGPKSRFADSSDEEDGGRPRFQSRFADSDSDDNASGLPEGLTPVRGIPRKAGDDDRASTDLEDEGSGDETAAVMNSRQSDEPKAPLAVDGNSKQASPLGARSLHHSKHAPGALSLGSDAKPKAKRGLFGLGKSKVQGPPTTAPETRSSPAADLVAPQVPFRQLSTIGEDKDVEASRPTSPRSSKLQRRVKPQARCSASDSWPLSSASSRIETGIDRPQSSDGVVQPKNPVAPAPDIPAPPGKNEEATPSVNTGDFSQGGKKKRFTGLRRVLGMKH